MDAGARELDNRNRREPLATRDSHLPDEPHGSSVPAQAQDGAGSAGHRPTGRRPDLLYGQIRQRSTFAVTCAAAT